MEIVGGVSPNHAGAGAGASEQDSEVEKVASEVDGTGPIESTHRANGSRSGWSY